jgi:tripartite-type tricarboxylate transporter receptor subunit TctC
MFKRATGINMTHVPYKGAAIALQDLLAGRVQLMFENLPTVLGYIRAGKLRALGIAGAQRAQALPELPTLAEQGIRGVEVTSWFGLVAPAGTPDEAAAALEKGLKGALNTTQAKARLFAMGADARPMSSEDFRALIRSDTAKWAEVVRATGARAE